MGVKTYKPVTPSRRFLTTSDFKGISSEKPEKSLLVPIKKSGGRNSNGRITVRRRGGGHKRFYRIIDYKRDKYGIPAQVDSVQYDPNRSARIALLIYADGEKRYILAPDGLKRGEMLMRVLPLKRQVYSVPRQVYLTVSSTMGNWIMIVSCSWMSLSRR